MRVTWRDEMGREGVRFGLVEIVGLPHCGILHTSILNRPATGRPSFGPLATVSSRYTDGGVDTGGQTETESLRLSGCSSFHCAMVNGTMQSRNPPWPCNRRAIVWHAEPSLPPLLVSAAAVFQTLLHDASRNA